MVSRQAATQQRGPKPREAQRRRTRAAIVEAAQRLLRAGTTPSIEDIAAAADVSRRTVYMYFPTLDQLLLDAAAGLLSTQSVGAAVAEDGAGTVRERVDALVRSVLDNADETLPLGRQIIRLTIDNAPSAGGPRRGYRRVQWLEQALAPARAQLTDEQFERLVSALAIVVGWEAMTVLRDVRGLDADGERGVLTWVAGVLVDAMLAERRPAE